MTLRGLFSLGGDQSRPAVPIDGGRAASRDRQAIQHRRDELRLDQPSRAHQTLAIAMNRLGGRSAPVRAAKISTGLRPSAARRSTGRVGTVRCHIGLSDPADIQIKMAQGAKPGEGASCPALGLPWVAKTRHSTRASA